MAPRSLKNPEIRFCILCGKIAEVRWRKEWFCGNCLNPEPSKDYLRIEREMAQGQWGGTGHDSWSKM